RRIRPDEGLDHADPGAAQRRRPPRACRRYENPGQGPGPSTCAVLRRRTTDCGSLSGPAIDPRQAVDPSGVDPAAIRRSAPDTTQKVSPTRSATIATGSQSIPVEKITTSPRTIPAIRTRSAWLATHVSSSVAPGASLRLVPAAC